MYLGEAEDITLRRTSIRRAEREPCKFVAGLVSQLSGMLGEKNDIILWAVRRRQKVERPTLLSLATSY